MDSTDRDEEKLCCFCNLSLKDRITFNNILDNMIKSEPSFIHMKAGESCHLECYFNEMIKLYLRNNGH